MQWSVSRRITVGFAVILTLLLIMTALAIWALSRTRGAYHDALDQRRTALVPALLAQANARGANAAFTRYLLESDNDVDAARQRDSLSKLTITLLRQNVDSARDDAERRIWEEALQYANRWDSASIAAVAARRVGNIPEASRIRRAVAQPARILTDERINAGVDNVTRSADASAREGTTVADVSQSILVTAAFIALLGGVLTGVLLNRAVSRPLQETSNVIASGTAEILAAATEQASSANETLAAVSETVATVDEVAQTAAQATERAQGVADSARRAAEIGNTGRRSVEDSIGGMTAVREQVEAIGRSILALAEQAQAIGDITSAVSDIAEQTNLLALNAAVEAARAGEAGRGFAVVASEIKSLAEQSKRSTLQVRQLLSEIQRATNAAVMATEQGSKQVATANKQINEAGDTIRTLAGAATEAAQISAQIVASAGQQSLGMEQIRQAVSSIHSATQQNLSASRQSEQAAQDLNQLGTQLVELVGRSREGRRI
jgi:methyl-accepting chemotaxis protein